MYCLSPIKVIYRLTKTALWVKVHHILSVCSCCRKKKYFEFSDYSLEPCYGYKKGGMKGNQGKGRSFHFFNSYYTVFTWIDCYKNIFGVFRVLSLSSCLWLILFAFFFSTIWPSTCGQINCHTLAAKAHRLSCGNGLSHPLEAHTQSYVSVPL